MNHVARWVLEVTDDLPTEVDDPVAVLGGKGSSLRKLAASGFPVPPGFTITTIACRRYYELGRQWPAGLMEQVVECVERLECRTSQAYGSLPSPLLLAVRGGAAVSMPGVLATFLDCGLSLALAEALPDERVWTVYADFICQLAVAQGAVLNTTEVARWEGEAACRSLLEQYERARGAPFPQDRWELLRQTITAVFDSWQQPRAAAFREVCGGDPAAGTAVTVQVMVHTDVAGVLFSRDPRDGREDRLLIEAVPGSGKRLVDGTTTPQRFCLDRKSLELWPEAGRNAQTDVDAERAEPSERLLDNTQLHDLGQIGLRLEECFEQPLDIEWGYRAGGLVIFQARPLVEDNAANVERLRLAEVLRLKRRAAAAGTRLWVRHNLSETLPSPTPLTWEVVRRWMSGSGGFGRLYRQWGYRPSPRVCRHGFLDLIAGRIYADPERVAEMFGAGLPLGYDRDALRADPSLIDQAPARFAPEKTDAMFLLRLPGIVWTLWVSSRRLKRGIARAAERFDRAIVPDYVAYVERERQLDLVALSDADTVTRLKERRARVLDEFAAESLRPGLFGALALADLEQRLMACLGPDEGGRVGRALVSGLETQPCPTQQTMLYGVATGQCTVSDFLQQFGHRGPNEMELAAPRWREMPEAVSQAADRLRAAGTRDLQILLAEAASQRAHVVESLPQRLRDCGASSLYPQIQKQLQCVQQLLPYREIGRDYLMMGYDLIRQVIEELTRRFGLGQDIYFLRWNEVLRLPKLGPPERPRIERRRSQWQDLQKLPLPDTIEVQQLDSLGLATALQTSGDELRGLSLSNGVAQGPVQIVRQHNPAPASSFPALPAGHILVCPALDPGCTPM